MVPYAAQKLARDGDAWTLPSMDLSDLYKLKRARYFACFVDKSVTKRVTNIPVTTNIFKLAESSIQH